MMGLPYGEEIVIVGQTVWTQSTSVTDRRTDGRTDRQSDRITITKTVQRRASHGKNDNACIGLGLARAKSKALLHRLCDFFNGYLNIFKVVKRCS